MRNLITTRKAAEILGISTRQVLRLVESKSLKPTAKLDGLRGAFLFEAEEIDQLKQTRGAA